RRTLDLNQVTPVTQVINLSGIADAYRPTLVYNNGRLLCYFQAVFSGSGNSRMWTTYSDNQGTSWVDYGPVDSASNQQFNQSVAYSKQDGNTYVVFEDTRNISTAGIDIYLAAERDGDGLQFDYLKNLSFNRAELHEISPSVAVYGNQVGVIYLEVPPFSNENNLCMIVSSSSFQSYSTYRMSQGVGNGFMHTSPSIAMGYRDRFTTAYGRYHLASNLLISRIDDITSLSAGSFSSNNLEQREIGTVPFDAANARSAVVAYAGADDNAIVSFAAHQTYEDGNTPETVPFNAYFGKVIFQQNVNYGKQ
ncbi:MAG: hypothetical protein ABIG42_08020, partial [bacterium]